MVEKLNLSFNIYRVLEIKILPNNVVFFFLEKKSEGDLMLVHCTHGLKRTGYLLSRYLIETAGLSPEVAIKGMCFTLVIKSLS